MTYTKTKPSAPGWYWWKSEGCAARIILVKSGPKDDPDQLYAQFMQRGEVSHRGQPFFDGPLIALDGEFAGPIPEPDQPVFATLHGPDGVVKRVLIHQPKKSDQD